MPSRDLSLGTWTPGFGSQAGCPAQLTGTWLKALESVSGQGREVEPEETGPGPSHRRLGQRRRLQRGGIQGSSRGTVRSHLFDRDSYSRRIMWAWQCGQATESWHSESAGWGARAGASQWTGGLGQPSGWSWEDCRADRQGATGLDRSHLADGATALGPFSIA